MWPYVDHVACSIQLLWNIEVVELYDRARPCVECVAKYLGICLGKSQLVLVSQRFMDFDFTGFWYFRGGRGGVRQI